MNALGHCCRSKLPKVCFHLLTKPSQVADTVAKSLLECSLLTSRERTRRNCIRIKRVFDIRCKLGVVVL